jgi:hypothetical protein
VCTFVTGQHANKRQARGHTPPTYLHLKQVFFEKSEKGREKNDEP